VSAASASASVSFTGNARHVWLVQGGKRYSAKGVVPAGRYEILALFEGAKKPVPAGEVDVAGGGEIVLRCTAFSQQCRY
jgi:hypothetical protein